MKKYTGAIIGGLIGGAVIVAIFFAIVLSGEKRGSDANEAAIVDEPAGTKQAETAKCTQGLEICNELDDDCDGEADEGCGGPAEFKHCWTLPEASPQITFTGEIGYRYRHLPGDPPLGSGLVTTTSWRDLAEVTNTSSACFRLVLDPGWSIEYQLAAEPSQLLGCAGHYPPGTLNGSHSTTLGDTPVNPVLIEGAHDCEFRFHRPMTR